jgi:Protein of unknown function (DUF5818)
LKTLLSVVAILSLATFLSAQQTPSPQPDNQPPSTQSDSGAQQTVDAQNQRSAKSFEGTIARSGDKLVLQDSATQVSYQLDNQGKAKKYEGQKVKVTATMDSNTNTLHVVDIAPSDNR